MADQYSGIRLQKQIAMGDTNAMSPGDFGVDSLSSHAAGGPGPKASVSGTLGDHERGAAPPVGGHQANPNHGDR